MNEKQKYILKNYFSDYARWFICITALFLLAWIALVMVHGAPPMIWILLLGFAIIYFMSFPLLILYVKARKDYSGSSIQKAVIKISDLQIDKKNNFINNGGAVIGKMKYKLQDENNNTYLLSSSDKTSFFTGFHPTPEFFVEVEYLKTSKIVLSLKIHTSHLKAHEILLQNGNINQLKRIFKIYF